MKQPPKNWNSLNRFLYKIGVTHSKNGEPFYNPFNPLSYLVTVISIVFSLTVLILLFAIYNLPKSIIKGVKEILNMYSVPYNTVMKLEIPDFTPSSMLELEEPFKTLKEVEEMIFEKAGGVFAVSMEISNEEEDTSVITMGLYIGGGVTYPMFKFRFNTLNLKTYPLRVEFDFTESGFINDIENTEDLRKYLNSVLNSDKGKETLTLCYKRAHMNMNIHN
jgi:hypothetical protein